jgi:hypothetical protein
MLRIIDRTLEAALANAPPRDHFAQYPSCAIVPQLGQISRFPTFSVGIMVSALS